MQIFIKIFAVVTFRQFFHFMILMILTLSECRSISSHTKLIILISNMQNCDFSSDIIAFERFISINIWFKFWMCRSTKMRISDTTFLFSWSFRFFLTTTSFTNVWHFFEIWAVTVLSLPILSLSHHTFLKLILASARAPSWAPARAPSWAPSWAYLRKALSDRLHVYISGLSYIR